MTDVTAVVVAVVVVAALGGLWKTLDGFRRTRCPRCDHPRLAIRPVQQIGEDTRLRCPRCNAEFVRVDGALIDHAAFDAGVRDGLPEARVVPRRDG